MIDKLSYDDILKISQELKEQSDIIEKLAEGRDLPELTDFAATVEGYSKFLQNTIEINRDADEALKDLKDHIR